MSLRDAVSDYAKSALPTKPQQPILDRAQRVHDRLDALGSTVASLFSAFGAVLSPAESLRGAEGAEASSEDSTLEEILAGMERKIRTLQGELDDLIGRNRL